MKKRNTILAYILTSALIFSGIQAPVMAASSNQITKDESVYVIGDADGNVTKTIVTDVLKNTGKQGKIKDKSILNNIENLKGNEHYEKKLGSINWQNKGADITYQGTVDKKLPVDIRLSYYLNGKELSARQIAHKSGHIKIRFDYQNDTANIPFTVISGIILDSSKFSNVSVSNGKCIEEGENLIVVGLALPGLDNSLQLEGIAWPEYIEISADTTDFTLEGTMSVATTETFKELDMDSINSLMDLTSSLNQFSEASTKLITGSDTLYKGIGTLLNKSGTLVTGVSKLNKGAAQLSKGAKDLKTGAQTLKVGVSQLSEKISTLSASIKTAQSGATTIKNGLKTAGGGLTKTIAANKQVLAGLEQMLQMDPSNENLQTMVGTLKQTITMQEQIADNMTEDTVMNGSPTLMKGVTELEMGLSAIYQGSTQLKTQGSDVLAVGAQQLISQGVEPLMKGAQELNGGLALLQSNSSKMLQGIKDLHSGAQQLKKGMTQFDQNGVQKIVNTCGNLDTFKARMNQTIDKASSYQSFTGLSEGMNGCVKFIYKTAAIE